MVFRGKITPETRAYARLLLTELKWSQRKVASRLSVSKSFVQRLAKCKLNPRTGPFRKKKGGRPSKLTIRDKRHIVKSLLHLRHSEGCFTSDRVMEEAGIRKTRVSARTVRRYLNDEGYNLLNARQKGILSSDDLLERVRYARKTRRVHNYSPAFWTENIAFYLDGVNFVHKTKPSDQARAPRKKVWRKKSEGLKPGCVAKGKKEGTGGNVVHMMVAVSYGKGVIICEQYEKLNGDYFADFIKRNFVTMFGDADKGHTEYFVQDGDPSQNSRVAKEALGRVKAKLFPIPPRSPDLNPIENVFHLVNKQLKKDARTIERETREEFSQRIRRTLYSVPVEVIDKTISSMDKRLGLIIELKGGRLKY